MRYTIVFILVLLSHEMESQTRSFDDLRLGIGVKLNIEIQNLDRISFRASATGGIGHYLKINDDGFGTLPTAHIGLLLYNRGIIGSQLDKNYLKSIFLDFFTNFTLTTGGKNIKNINRIEDRRVPLYHFSDFTANPLLNTFKHSLSFGTNIILNPDKNRSPQVFGFVNLNIARTAQVSYYNDGGPILKYLGDKKDRYYTGGIVLSAHFNSKAEINLVELSFHKFTGWQQYAFDDVQDIIHFSRDNPFHPDYFYSYRIAPGIGYSSYNTGF